MVADTYTSIKDIEAEAEKIIDEAKGAAKSALETARVEARKILSSEASLGDVAETAKEILAQAEEEARKKIEEAERRAVKLKKNSSEKVDSVVKEILGYMSGAR